MKPPITTKEGAISFLELHLDEIHTVQEWANSMGYSRSHFSVILKKGYGTSAYHLIKEKKYQRIKYLVQKNPRAKGMVIAHKTGFKDVKALYKFLHLHYQTSLTKLRKRAKNGF